MDDFERDRIRRFKMFGVSDPDAIRRLLSPEIFVCKSCEKEHESASEAAICDQKDQYKKHLIQEEEKRKADLDKERAERLKKALEDNLL